jgi:glycosyltransferase involved in cell wall biosynthesis
MSGNAPAAAPQAPPAPGARPRIAFVTEQYDHVNSGPGTFARYLRAAVEDGRLDLTFLSNDIADPRHPFERRVEFPVSLPAPASGFVRQAAWHRAFLADHARRPFDVLWYNTAVSGWLSSVSRRRAPVVLMLNDYSNALTGSPARALRVLGPYRLLTRGFWSTFERSALRRAEAVVVNSRFLRDEVLRRYPLAPDRVRVLYKAVDTGLFARHQPARPLDQNPVRVLFVKNDYPLGGLPELLRALARAAFPSELTVVGPPPGEFGRIRGLAAAAGYRGTLTLAGRVSRAELPARFAAHDLLCVPSRAEALGVVFLEALASGLPAVGSSVGGIPEALDEGRAGWMAPAGDPDGLRATLERVVGDADERERRVRHGLAHAAGFSPARMVDTLAGIAGEVAGKAGADVG